MAEPSGFAAYRGDLAAALGAWRYDPRIPMISAALALATLLPERWLWVGLPAFAFSAGWVGTERMFYLRAFRGLPLLTSERWRFTWAFFGRYALLGLVMSAPLCALLWLTVVTGSQGLILPGIIVVGVLLDVALTFVTPALAFTTRRVTVAWRVGHRTLVDGWPSSAWYALVPPLAALIAFRALPLRVAGVAVLTAFGSLLNLWFKGAVAAYYLRVHEVGDDGAVDAPLSESLDRRMRDRFRPEES